MRTGKVITDNQAVVDFLLQNSRFLVFVRVHGKTCPVRQRNIHFFCKRPPFP